MHIMDYLSALHTRRPSLESLEPRIRAWAERVGLWGNTTLAKQFDKFIEECEECSEALESGDKDQIAAEAGDIFFTLSMMAQTLGATLGSCIGKGFLIQYPVSIMGELIPYERSASRDVFLLCIGAIYGSMAENVRIELAMAPAECLALAVNKVEKRTGKVVDGFFVKDADG